MGPKALICGVSGQDGAYLAKLLLEKGFGVAGTTRTDPAAPPRNLELLGIAREVEVLTMQPSDIESVRNVLGSVKPEEIYYLASQSSVGASFERPLETWESATFGLLNVLEAARSSCPDAKILNAASGDCFGESLPTNPAREDSAFAPCSPYGAAKCAAHHAVSVARVAYGQRACSAFLFNHESPLRPSQFVVGKVVAAVKAIKAGKQQRVQLGDLTVVRDWGWAPEYVDAMRNMLRPDSPRDYVVATGKSCPLEDLVSRAFAEAGLDWRDHVSVAAAAARPGEIYHQHADPGLIQKELGWNAQTDMPQMIAKLIGTEGPANN